MKKYKISIWFLISLMMIMSVLSAVPDYVEEDLPEVVMNIMVKGLILFSLFITVIALVFLSNFVRKSFKK